MMSCAGRELVRAGLVASVLLIPFHRPPVGEDPAVYRAMFDQARDSRLVLDGQSHILHANREAANLFGATENSLRGVAFSELVAPRTRAGFVLAWETARTQGAHVGPVALDGRSANGSTFPMEVEVIHGSSERYGVVVRDLRTPGRKAPPGFNPGQLLIAGRIQELV